MSTDSRGIARTNRFRAVPPCRLILEPRNAWFPIRSRMSRRRMTFSMMSGRNPEKFRFTRSTMRPSPPRVPAGRASSRSPSGRPWAGSKTRSTTVRRPDCHAAPTGSPRERSRPRVAPGAPSRSAIVRSGSPVGRGRPPCARPRM
ncbi:hypothetical protein SDC9_179556 [bioreactor metagenome]|uniref:Uncharacterized protein n=1 Tax=bioreactor metagenome TaxID=1076179 RepID=A0A645H078_9ZZZZ